MARFADSQWREWDVVIDVLQLKRVRERTKFELGKLFADDMARLKQLAAEPEVLVDVLFVLVEEEAQKRGIPPEMFGRSLTGDAIEAGFDALMEAYANFCPSRQAKPLRALMAKNKELSEAATARAMTGIAAVNLESILNGSAGSAAESAGPIPAPAG